mgnify:CR=1 FL=1
MICQDGEGFIPVNGGNVWYRMIGSERPGVPLVILHGGPGAPHDYLEPLDRLADERPVIFYDQLGCGNSDKPDNLLLWTVERFVEELADVQAALGLTEVHLLGQSWGTTLAVEYMLRKEPHHVRSLVLSAPFFSATRWIVDQRAHLAQLPEQVQASVREAEQTGNYDSADYQQAMQEFYQRHVCRLDPWPDVLNRTIEKISVPVYHSMCGPSEFSVIGSLKDLELIDRLQEIAVPALLTCGRYDESTPETTAIYHQALPGSEMVVLEESSHEHHLEQLEDYLAIVRDFLKRAD